jgi:hypothetical protein
MTRRSHKHRKRFTCGHRGFGKHCHCCANRLAKQQKTWAAKQATRQAWQQTFAEDEIDLSHLPRPIVLKARQILAALKQGQEYWKLGGRRLNSVRDMVRIPVTRRYRLLCYQENDRIVPLEALSHEDYNPLVRKAKQWFSRLVSRG